LIRSQAIRVAFGDELQREGQRPIALDRRGLLRAHQALSAPREYLARRRTCFVAAVSLRRHCVESLFLQVLIERVSRYVDRARVAPVADDVNPRRGETHEAGRIAAVAADDRSHAVAVADDELIDERGVEQQRIAE